MGIKYSEDGRIQDLNFTLTLTGKCNLSCEYCPLLYEKQVISNEILDDYIHFFRANEEELKKLTHNIVFIFFGGEPLLCLEKIQYFMERMYDFGVKTKFVIYTNALLLNQEVIDYLKTFPDYSKRIIFYISIDGGLDVMKKYRLKRDEDFYKIEKNLHFLKTQNFNFSFSKVILEEDGNALFGSLRYLHTFSPEKLDCLPMSFYRKGGYTRKQIVEIIKGYELFLKSLLDEGYLERNILEYLGLPDDLSHLKKLFKSDYGLYGNYDGNIYPLCDSLPIFSLGKTFNEEEKAKIKLGNITDHKRFIEILRNYPAFEEEFYHFGKNWHDREFPNEISVFGIINMYFVKKLLLYRNRSNASNIRKV